MGKKRDESMEDTELSKQIEKLGWTREDDVQPKDSGSPWQYFSRGVWRILVGTLGWMTCYRKTDAGIEDIESRRLLDREKVLELVKSRS